MRAFKLFLIIITFTLILEILVLVAVVHDKNQVREYREIAKQEEQKQKDIKSERCWLFTARISSHTDPRFFTNTTAKSIYNECNR